MTTVKIDRCPSCGVDLLFGNGWSQGHLIRVPGCLEWLQSSLQGEDLEGYSREFNRLVKAPDAVRLAAAEEPHD